MTSWNLDIDVIGFIAIIIFALIDFIVMREAVKHLRDEIALLREEIAFLKEENIEIKQNHMKVETALLEKLNSIETKVAFIKGKMSKE